jgi:hypothetical protein
LDIPLGVSTVLAATKQCLSPELLN